MSYLYSIPIENELIKLNQNNNGMHTSQCPSVFYNVLQCITSNKKQHIIIIIVTSSSTSSEYNIFI